MSATIQTDKLTKFYGRNRGIEDISLSVEAGEIFGFIGPNGAGKSTTIRTLLGLIKPTSGSAKIFGKDTERHGPEIREEIGYLPSEVFYYDGMRVRDLLNYSASFYKKPKSTMKNRIDELAAALELDVSKKIDDLSYGNKKKVGIVQGLLHSPKLIILDEPTGGLDPLMQQRFFEILREENKRGATVLFSSHILSEVQKLCDRVAIIKNGKLIRVERIASMRNSTHLRCRVELADMPSANAFVSKNITDLSVSERTASFLWHGDVNTLMTLLAQLNLASLTLAEPELEEIFMHYYQDK